MKKRLWLSEGITDKSYILEDLKKSSFYYQTFDEIYVFPNEKYLSRWSLEVPIWDRFGDILKYCFNPLRIKKVRSEALKMFHSVDRKPEDFDFAIGHSLGTLSLLTLPASFNVVFTCGSPLGFPTFPILGARQYIEWFTETQQKDGKCIKTKNWVNFYGRHDHVVSRDPIGPKWFKRAVSRMSLDPEELGFFQHETETHHDFTEYASAMGKCFYNELAI